MKRAYCFIFIDFRIKRNILAKAFLILAPYASHYKGLPCPEIILIAIAFTSLVLKRSRNHF